MTPEEIERHVDVTAATIGLPIPPEMRPGVVGFFGITAAMAQLVMAQPLGAADEPANVFVPVDLHEGNV